MILQASGANAFLPFNQQCQNREGNLRSKTKQGACGNAFSALTLLVEWQEGHLACKKTEWWDAGMVICLR